MPESYDSWMAGEEREPLDVPTSKTALIVVDMQNGFCVDEYSIGKGIPGRSIENFKKAIPGCVALVEAAHAAGQMVIFTRISRMPGDGDAMQPMGRKALLPRNSNKLVVGDPSIELIDELTPIEGDFVIDKSRPSSFYGTRLEPLLTANKISTVIICGVTTNICVETTARDASQRGYDTYVVEDATGEFEMSRHWHALYTINWSFGSVVTVADVQRSWGVPIGMPALSDAVSA
jgi:nicotinamidase-related amidase